MLFGGYIAAQLGPPFGCRPQGRGCQQVESELKNSPELKPDRFSTAAAAGLRVFPVLPSGKRPAVAWSEFVERAPSAEELRSWDASDFNVGVVCGAPSRVVVLDVDSADAQALVDTLDLPATPCVSTGRGRHYYFKPPAVGLRNSAHVANVKLDVRGDGGYAVGAGSMHESGAPYQWIISPVDLPFAEFPANLLELLSQEKSAKPVRRHTQSPETADMRQGSGVHRFLEEELSQAKVEIEAAAQGERNDTLFKKAVSLARHCAGGQADWTAYASRLADSAAAVGLEDEEVAATLESAWKAGSAEPTEWLRIAAEHVYLGAQDMFYHRSSGTDLKPAGFNGVFGHHYGGKGAFSKFLLTNGYVEKVQDIDYCPFRPAGTFEREGQTWFNSFKPSEVVAIEGDATPFLDFLTHHIPEATERDHVLTMMAFTVRNPGRKVRHALLLRTREQGVGKSMLTEIWGALLGRSNVRKTNSKELKSDYQGYIAGHLLVVCEELNLGMGLSVYNDLKDLLTGDTALINEKFLRQREQNTYATFAFLTNRPVPLLIEDADRRIFFIDSPAEKRDAEYYVTFSSWWRANLGVIRYHLDQIDLTEFNEYSPPPMTDAKQELIDRSRSELAQDLALLIDARSGYFDRDVVTLDEVVRELGHAARGKTHAQISKALGEIGAVSLGQQRVGGRGRLSLWCIRNTGYWAFVHPVDRAHEYLQTTGTLAVFNDAGLDVVHASLWPADEALLFPPKPANLVRLLRNPDYDWPPVRLAV